jgi:release factor glutamine methyltransferase
MTIKDALAEGQKILVGSLAPLLDSRLLLEQVLSVNHSYLIAHDGEHLNIEQELQYRSLLNRAARKVPIPYLVGKVQFLGLDIKVAPEVLIPRPETERLVQYAREWVVGNFGALAPVHIVDVGTGSGCIALSMARILPMARVEATDISAAALKIAQDNARALGLDERVIFHHGPLLDPILEAPDLVIANLPYIADHEWTSLDDGVKWYEPDVALRGGSDGLDGIRQLLAQASDRLAAGAALFLEIGWQQGKAVNRVAQSTFPSAKITVLPDYSGIDRVVSIVVEEAIGDR